MSLSSDSENTWQDRLMTAAVAVLTVVYSWLASYVLEPKFPEPKETVSTVIWLEKGEFKNWQKVKAHRMLETSRLARGINRAQNALAAIGGLAKPIQLVIHVDEPDRYAVTQELILLGSNLLTNGEIERAFLKAWLMQRARPELSNSIFRMNVAADALTILLLNDIGVEIGADKDDRLPTSWLDALASSSSICRSLQKPLELQGHCGESNEISTFAFRSLLARLLASERDTVGVGRRMGFAKEWSESLRAPRTDFASNGVEPRTLEDWRAWLRREYQALRLEQDSGALTQQFARVRLHEESRLDVETIFKRDAGAELPEKVSGPARYMILNEDGGSVVYPASVSLSAIDTAKARARVFVWETCTSPAVNDIVTQKPKTRGFLYVKNCTKSAKPLEAFVRGGVRQLAKQVPDVPFLQLRGEFVELAVRMGKVDLHTRLDQFLERKLPVETLTILGIDTAVWKKDLRAFEVTGAIEAIEWFRSPTGSI